MTEGRPNILALQRAWHDAATAYSRALLDAFEGKRLMAYLSEARHVVESVEVAEAERGEVIRLMAAELARQASKA